MADSTLSVGNDITRFLQGREGREEKGFKGTNGRLHSLSRERHYKNSAGKRMEEKIRVGKRKEGNRGRKEIEEKRE